MPETWEPARVKYVGENFPLLLAHIIRPLGCSCCKKCKVLEKMIKHRVKAVEIKTNMEQF